MTDQGQAAHIERQLVDYFSSLLRLDKDRIDTGVHLLELGLDSIMLIEAQRMLKERHGLSIEVGQFFEELNTIGAIAAFIASRPGTDAVPTGRPVIAPVNPDLQAPAREPLTAPTSGRDLMKAQLQLVADVIEAQNRLLSNRKPSGHSAP